MNLALVIPTKSSLTHYEFNEAAERLPFFKKMVSFSADSYALFSPRERGIFMSNDQKYITVKGQKTPVTPELYKEYYKMKRRERYLESDVKLGRIDVDMEKEEVSFVPSKEDSIQRLMDIGQDFNTEDSVEGIIEHKAMLLILQEAMEVLNEQEKQLIDYLFYQELTTREAGKKINASHVTVLKRRNAIIKKLKKFFKF